MLDIRLIREDKDKVIELVAKKGNDVSNEVNKVYELDLKRRDITFEVEGLKNKQNTVSKEIPKLKKEGKDVSEILNEMKELSEKIKSMDIVLNEIDEELDESELEEVSRAYSDIINNCSERFEFFTKVLYAYNGYQTEKNVL